MSDEESDYEEATPEQKLAISTYFIMSSPVGEVEEVITDVKKLVKDPSVLSEAKLGKILKNYNLETMATAKDPEGDKNLMVCAHGQVADDMYVDPSTGRVIKFNHRKREFTEVTEKKQVLSASVAGYREQLETYVNSYVEGIFKGDKCTPAVFASDAGVINICLSAKNVSLGNFWTGSWRSVYTLNVSKKGSVDMEGTVKVNVHYFEDGNVQLHSDIKKKVKVQVGAEADTAKAVATAISKIEDEYQTELEEMYVSMHTSTFKAMRRFLPVSRQQMNWNTAAHQMASEMGN